MTKFFDNEVEDPIQNEGVIDEGQEEGEDVAPMDSSEEEEDTDEEAAKLVIVKMDLLI